jgi:hypothetical protein
MAVEGGSLDVWRLTVKLILELCARVVTKSAPFSNIHANAWGRRQGMMMGNAVKSTAGTPSPVFLGELGTIKMRTSDVSIVTAMSATDGNWLNGVTYH